MIQQTFVAVWLCALSLNHVCQAQSVREILERSSRSMAPPIKYRLSVNGKSCTVFQQRLDDNSLAMRMEFANPASLVRIETNSASLEVYPKAKLVIDVGFMRGNSLSPVADVWEWMESRLPRNEDALHLATDTEFEGQKCWKITRSSLDRLGSSTPNQLDQERAPKEIVAYIDKQTYHIVGVETYSKAGEKLVQSIISNIESPSQLSNDLFIAPVDFRRRKPLSIVEYLSERESLVATQLLTQLTDEAKARQMQAQNRLAAARARVAAAPKPSQRLNYYLSFLIFCMVAFVIVTAIWSQRRTADRWKQIASDPAVAQAEVAKMLDAANMSSWTRFNLAPLVLKAFVIYAVCALIVGLVLPFIVPLRALSSVLGFPLIVPLVLIHTALSRFEWRRSVYAAAGLLAFYGAIGTSKYLSILRLNPLLPSSTQYSAPFLVYEIVMPIAWAFLLMSPSMLRWLRAKSNVEAQVHQLSMADLLYFMLVAGLAVAASAALLRSMN